jgi:hypothetical protein
MIQTVNYKWIVRLLDGAVESRPQMPPLIARNPVGIAFPGFKIDRM